MAREARLFDQHGGSPSRALFKLRGNVPPSWIDRATDSRKSRQPEVAKAIRKLNRLRRARPNAKATIRSAEKDLRTALKDWEVAYRKECFYYGIRVLLELQRAGKTRL